ncbi:hypothetical protein [Rhizobium sp. Rhizsp42]|uniref:hypothetical protein n=1 Tax=Rhizobium sp. Rhizsp42 TaxID=3243034 RepID=UPI0039AEBB94
MKVYPARAIATRNRLLRMAKVVMQKHHRECPATDDFTADDIVHARGLAHASPESERLYQDDVYSIVAALRDIEAM